MASCYTRAHRSEEIEDLNALYCLPDLLVNYAVMLSEEKHLPLQAAFEYADCLHDFGGDFSEDSDPEDPDGLSPEERLRELTDDDFYQFMFFERGISVSLSCSLQAAGISRDTIKRADPKMLPFYDMWNIQFTYLTKAWEYFKENAPSDYTEEELVDYIENIYSDIPMEIAFELVLPPPPTSEEMIREAQAGEMSAKDWERYDAFDEWARQETEWNDQHFTREVDVDNLSYEDDSLDY